MYTVHVHDITKLYMYCIRDVLCMDFFNNTLQFVLVFANEDMF